MLRAIRSNTNMLIGYARVSTDDQNLNLQRDALKKASCEQIYTDQVSGTKAKRPGLEQALSHLRAGDTLVVWRLDRLGRSLRHLIDTVTNLQEKGIGFKSLTESIDTTTSGGKLVFHIFGALAEFEREIIRERTKAGLTAARARGRSGGRRTALTPKQAQIAKELYQSKTTSVADICKTLNISRATFYRYVAAGQRDTKLQEKTL
jgi:DNA invertase Pin-like site-specific DNA recombinase